MLKSGSEFREFSQITVTFPNSKKDHAHKHTRRRPVFEVVRHEVTGGITPNPELHRVVQHYLNKVRGVWFTGPGDNNGNIL